MLRLPPLSTLFPYTTLFRSVLVLARAPLLRLVDRPDDVLDREGRPVMPFDVRVQLERVGLRIWRGPAGRKRSEEHTSELQSHSDLVCRLLLEKKKNKKQK